MAESSSPTAPPGAAPPEGTPEFTLRAVIVGTLLGLVFGAPGPGRRRADLAASFQAAAVDVLVTRCRQAVEQTGHPRLAVGGGVAANAALRHGLTAMAAGRGIELFIPPLAYCTDNAAMAAAAVEHWRRGRFAALDLDANPTTG